jgi:3-hydroxyacyl-[acyl-carrier-protein] dehydratase
MPENSSVSATNVVSRHFAVGHPAAEGHFPGNRIIPGAVLLREIVAAISSGEESGGNAARCRDIRAAKFRHPVRPGDTIVVSWTEQAGGEISFSCSVAGSDGPAVTGALRLDPS